MFDYYIKIFYKVYRTWSWLFSGINGFHNVPCFLNCHITLLGGVVVWRNGSVAVFCFKWPQRDMYPEKN